MDLAGLDGQDFDVAVIGAGINGASSAQHLQAAGYRVLLVDKGDFAAGASSRSTRMLHCGLRYFETPRPFRGLLLRPRRLGTALRMARASMQCRADLVEDAPQRLVPFDLFFPLYRDGPYRPWQMDLAFATLERLGDHRVPLDYRRLAPADALERPLVGQLARPEALRCVASFREYLFDWPERFCIDAALDAERLGARVRTFTEARLIERTGERWRIGLTDTLDGAGAEVTASTVLNMAGVWIDEVNASYPGPATRRLILGTKGAHIVVQLPERFRGQGLTCLNSLGEPHYCLPSQGGLHHIGPTETVFDGDPDDVRVNAEEVDFLLAETAALLPGLGVTAKDVIYTWAGVRPLTRDPDHPKGNRSRVIHDLSGQGLPGVLAMTAGPIMSHRCAGRDMVDALAGTLAPSTAAATPDFRPRLLPEQANATPLVEGDPVLTSHLGHLARHEHGRTLSGLLYARTGLGYRHRLDEATVRRAAGAVSAHLGWDPEAVEREVRDTLALGRRVYQPDGEVAAAVTPARGSPLLD